MQFEYSYSSLSQKKKKKSYSKTCINFIYLFILYKACSKWHLKKTKKEEINAVLHMAISWSPRNYS